MEYLLLSLSVILISLQNIVSKKYNHTTRCPNIFIYSAISAFFAMLFFIVSSGFRFNFSIGYLPYSLGFAAAYSASLVGMNYAVKTGSLSVTALIMSYSLIIPTFYGIIFLKENAGCFTYIGILLLLISLFLINIKKEKNKVSLKWIFFLIIMFTGNGMCSTLQKAYSLKCGTEFKNEFMIAALAVTTFFLMLWGILNEKDSTVKAIKYSAPFAVINGFSNGAVNLFIILLTGMLPNSLIFPTISAGGIILTFIVSVTVYSEKLSKIQLCGYIIGTAAVIVLNF